MAENKKPYGDVSYADPGYQSDGKKRYPLDTERHCRAAWSYINQKNNAGKYTSEQLAKIKARIKSALKSYGVDVGERSAAIMEGEFNRSFALDDICIRSGGDGRTVEAYAAVFSTPAEINDSFGHYVEEIAPSAFTKTIAERSKFVKVFYHHAMTLHGTPSELGSVPLGLPLEIKADRRGLLTVTRYNKSQLADSVLESIRNGEITGQSFSGRIFKSDPMKYNRKIPAIRSGDGLPHVRRTELGLAEYGPTPTPAYAEAAVLALRSVNKLPDEDRERLVSILAGNDSTSQSEAGDDTPSIRVARQSDVARRIAIERVRLGIGKGK